MGLSPRELIMQNLQTTLQAVAGVVKVERVMRAWDEIGDAAQMPWIGLMPEPERIEQEPFGQLWCYLPVTILCHLNVDEATHQSAASAMLDSLIAGLLADGERGGNAVQTDVTEGSTDEAVDNFVKSKGGELSLQFKIEVQYQRTKAAS